MIECETAAQCAEVAQIQQSLVLDAILATVVLVVVWRSLAITHEVRR